jgi:predicted dehydrogenase
VPRSLQRGGGLTALILGWSAIARRRVAPAFAAIGITALDVASRTRQVVLPDGVCGRAFRDYDEALAHSAATLVYVSTRNHEHAAWARAALASGRDVVIDKPAAIALADVEALADLAAGQGRSIAEATVYPWHPQIDALRELARTYGPVTRITATFSFPSLPADDVRWRAEWGGGALWDLGPYAVTPGRLLFDAEPMAITAQAVTPADREVDTSFSLLMTYPGDRVLVGHFGMGTAYVNRLQLLGPRLELTLDRAFTTSPTDGTRIVGHASQSAVDTAVPPADAFACFLRAVIDGERRSWFAETMVTDARALDALRTAAAQPAAPSSRR